MAWWRRWVCVTRRRWGGRGRGAGSPYGVYRARVKGFEVLFPGRRAGTRMRWGPQEGGFVVVVPRGYSRSSPCCPHWMRSENRKQEVPSRT